MTSSCWGLAVRGQQCSVDTTLPRKKPKEPPDPTAHTPLCVLGSPRPCSAGLLTANHPWGAGGVHLEGLGAWESLPGEEAWEGASVRDGRSGAMGQGGQRPCPVPCAFLPLLDSGRRGQASRVQPPEPEKRKERTLSRSAQAGRGQEFTGSSPHVSFWGQCESGHRR